MNDLQRQTARAIVNIFETGRVRGDYGSVTLLKGDSGHLTYGRSQTTLGSGNLFLLIRAYCARPDATFASQLTPFLPALAARDAALDVNAAFRDLLREAGDDAVMREEQDRIFDEHYLNPAIAAATARGITEPLGQTVVYDSTVHGGFAKVAARVGAAIGAGVDQREWVTRYVAARRAWLKSLPAPLPATTYRMDAFDKLIAAGAWDMALDLSVRGATISPGTLGEAVPVVRATAADPTDPPPPPVLVLTTPFMRGDHVKRVQEALKANGFDIAPDGVYGDFTEALVRQFQAKKQLNADGVVGPLTLTALGL